MSTENLLIWEEKYLIGISEIDDQHKRIFELINTLYNEMRQKGKDANLAQILDELMHYAEYHFTTEENYFEKFQFEGREDHVKIHRDYKEKITQFRKAYIDGEALVSFDVLDFLEDWWVQHISIEDRKYINSFRANELIP